jgi:hypothetical protein
MSTIARILLSSLIGGIVCAVLSFFMFFLMTALDGTKAAETFGYSIIVSIACAFIGAMIGLVIGIGNVGVIGGGIIGILGTLAVVAFYVLAFSTPGKQAYFLSESRIIFVVLTLPTILTGIITVLLKNLIYKA